MIFGSIGYKQHSHDGVFCILQSILVYIDTPRGQHFFVFGNPRVYTIVLFRDPEVFPVDLNSAGGRVYPREGA